MIISRTPFRVSFFGGGTDYPEWFMEEPGAVLSTAIDQYLYITCRYLPPFFSLRHRIVWSKVEVLDSFGEIEHPVIREGLKYLRFRESEGLDIHYQADLPARSGVGSSSSFAVGFINALSALKGERLSKHQLAKEAIHLERNILGEIGGYQDQIAAAYGGINKIVFLPDGDFRVEPIALLKERVRELENETMLFFTGISRNSSDIASNVVGSFKEKKASLIRMRDMVDEGVEILCSNEPISHLGTLLDEAWKIKRNLSGAISNSVVDQIYETAVNAGAKGGKLLGAGQAGFMMFVVDHGAQADVKSALKDLLYVPYRTSAQGSAILDYSQT
jgi:D-glycero-alpha-D-manno-heptose-7-phosphate kinase